ncbi:MAG: acetyl-CoA carboxylase carboxyltransferase subunit alpha [Eubacterium sp.]|nr:acetyl-CoA carboxylase carboxyltransferase subunit alpha [Eubacterium sp.]
MSDNKKKTKIKTPYERVLAARDPHRAGITDYIEGLFTDFIELKGDRLGKEDAAILGGIALFEGRPVTVIGHRKGKDLEENLAFNFGMPEPEGYRKALRLMKQAEKFGRPVITFIDTPGAYPGKEAEENGQSNAIAENLREMSALKIPVICFVTGEGNSGGALAIGVGNKVYMLENAVYCVLSPEGFASILFKDASKKEEASKSMKMTAHEIFEAGLCDGVIDEDSRSRSGLSAVVLENIRSLIRTELSRTDEMTGEEIAADRFAKFRQMGRNMV